MTRIYTYKPLRINQENPTYSLEENKNFTFTKTPMMFIQFIEKERQKESLSVLKHGFSISMEMKCNILVIPWSSFVFQVQVGD